MEVLHYEVLDLSTPLYVLITMIVLTSLLAIGAGLELGKWIGIGLEILIVSIFIFAHISEDKPTYEYQKVKVSDWNIVHNEGWEIIKQEGEIVELKRKLEEE